MRKKDGPTAEHGDGITRRDFIHDVALAGVGLALAGTATAGETDGISDGVSASERYYPPTRTGLRGSHSGAFEAAHGLAREGRALPDAKALDESYDLVVVGAGISGLAAAYFYRQRFGSDARILLLDNHDDFGGHAKRNEFHQGGRLQLAWGGTVNIEHWHYSEVGHRLLRELGIDIQRLLANTDYDWGSSGTGLGTGTWFDRQTFGRDALVAGFSLDDLGRSALRQALPDMPLPDSARDALLTFLDREDDVLAGLSADERSAWMHSTAYFDFLRDHCDVPDEALGFLSPMMMGIWGVRTDDLSVAECLESGLPGAHRLGIPESEYEDIDNAAMFPDGNASIARLLVRSLVPQAFPGLAGDIPAEAIVTAALDYDHLDRPENAVRLRLNATVLEVENSGEGVALSYLHDGQLYRLRAAQCVLACYNRIIPHICPSLPEAQKAGLAQCIKRPMGTVNVVLRNGRAIEAGGLASVCLPGSMLQLVTVVSGFDAGAYESRWDPAAPCQLHFFFGVSPENPDGLSMVAQSQAGRLRLLAMRFEDFEVEVKRVLRGIWGAHGLDPEADILAITVNRWPHGYARDLLDLEAPEWLAEPGPYEVGRQPFGNIVIANSDAGADAYTHTAIDQAWRAVGELQER